MPATIVEPMIRHDGTREDEVVSFEAVIKSVSGKSMFDPNAFLTPDNIEDFKPTAGAAELAARRLQHLGFRILHVGTFSVSGEAPQDLWEKTFGTKIQRATVDYSTIKDLGQRAYLFHVPKTPFDIPKELSDLVEKAYPQKPPTFLASPLPPTQPNYHYLNVPGDVSMLLRADLVHKAGVTGKGVLVAMTDTGFYNHPYYLWHGYNYGRTLSPDAVDVELDSNGHGTAEAANIFASAPDIDFIGVKMGGNATLAFKTAVDLNPAVITNSWAFHLPNISQLPNFLKPLEAEVIRAVKELGITVIFSGGNGHVAFPAMMPEVIAVGGVYAHRDLADDDFDMEASNYASSFVSAIYPGRAVPDVCGLVGQQPRGIYIMLPVPPQSAIDQGLGGGSFPNQDETATDDGWAVISGTSASAPQVAGICALLKQVQPSLSPALIKNILSASARDVKKGQSAMGQQAGKGFDSATGAGLVDAFNAYRLARSVQVRPLATLPAPR